MKEEFQAYILSNVASISWFVFFIGIFIFFMTLDVYDGTVIGKTLLLTAIAFISIGSIAVGNKIQKSLNGRKIGDFWIDSEGAPWRYVNQRTTDMEELIVLAHGRKRFYGKIVDDLNFVDFFDENSSYGKVHTKALRETLTQEGGLFFRANEEKVNNQIIDELFEEMAERLPEMYDEYDQEIEQDRLRKIEDEKRERDREEWQLKREKERQLAIQKEELEERQSDELQTPQINLEKPISKELKTERDHQKVTLQTAESEAMALLGLKPEHTQEALQAAFKARYLKTPTFLLDELTEAYELLSKKFSNE